MILLLDTPSMTFRFLRSNYFPLPLHRRVNTIVLKKLCQHIAIQNRMESHGERSGDPARTDSEQAQRLALEPVRGPHDRLRCMVRTTGPIGLSLTSIIGGNTVRILLCIRSGVQLSTLHGNDLSGIPHTRGF